MGIIELNRVCKLAADSILLTFICLLAACVDPSGSQSGEVDVEPEAAAQADSNLSEGKVLVPGTPAVVDLGRVPAGSVQIIICFLKNNRDIPLKIVGVSRSCTCTVPEFSAQTIEPGKQIKMTVGMAVSSEEAPVANSIKVLLANTDDVEAGAYEAVFKMQAVRALVSEELSLSFGLQQADEPDLPAFRIQRGQMGLEFTDIKVSCREQLGLAFAVSSETPDAWLVQVQAPRGLIPGALAGTLEIAPVTREVESPGKLLLPFSGIVKGDILLSSTVFFFGELNVNSGTTKTISIQLPASLGAKEVDLNLETQHDNLAVDFEITSREVDKLVLRLTVSPQKRAVISELLRFKASDGSESRSFHLLVKGNGR